MAAIWITPGFTYSKTQGEGAITPIPCNVTINGGTPILEGSVVAPHGTHTGTITINTGLGPSNILIGGKRVAIATSKASCGDGIAPGPPDPPPKTLSTTVTI